MTRDAQDTRDRLLRSARALFAARGFEQTTVRAVAAEVGVDPALVLRYFGSKEGLLAQASEVDLALPSLEPRAGAGEALVRHFASRWEGPEADDLLRVLLRSAATHQAARDRMRAVLGSQVSAGIAQIVEDRATVPVRAALVASQILGLAFCRYVLDLPEPDLGNPATVRALGATLDRYIFEPL